jgi:catechol 2,3-dioxygenase-like lactoylglutathione lyase family enzyme
VKVLGVTFVGTRTTNFEATTAFFRDVLGLETAFSNPNWSVFKFASGDWDLLEVFGDQKRDERLMPYVGQSGTMVGFVVDDIVAGRAELEAAGTELIGDFVWVDDLSSGSSNPGFGWFFFRAPDGNIYALQQLGISSVV